MMSAPVVKAFKDNLLTEMTKIDAESDSAVHRTSTKNQAESEEWHRLWSFLLTASVAKQTHSFGKRLNGSSIHMPVLHRKNGPAPCNTPREGAHVSILHTRMVLSILNGF